MQFGPIWGDGGYLALDWSADWLHRKGMALIRRWAPSELGAATYAALPDELAYAATCTIMLDRAAAIAVVSHHYQRLFGNEADTPSCAKPMR
jgi:nitric oxide reductase subunit B